MMNDLFCDIKKEISNKLDEKNLPYSKIEPEGPEIGIYTTDPKIYFDDKKIIGDIADYFKKKINIRTEKTSLMDVSEAYNIITKLIPQDAGVKNIYFDSIFGEVVIEALKPGVVIGKQGAVSKEIIYNTNWIPKIIRAPTDDSDILKKVRSFIYKNTSERKTFLKDVAKKIYSPPVSSKDWIRMTALGGFGEIGRSSILLETPDTKILLDCGINQADKNEEFPYLGVLRFPLEELDAVVISHTHIDHIGFLPYLFKVGYNGPVYCTEPTRDLMALLLFDSINVNVSSGKEPLFSEEHVVQTIKHCIVRNYREVTNIAPDVKLTFYNAGHVLGSSSVHLHIGAGKHNLVYSGDIKYGFTRLLNNIDMDFPRLETLIIESTYGDKKEVSNRSIVEEQLIQTINDTAAKGGITLIPAFSVGRAQEVMLVLEEYKRRGKLNVDKVYIDGLTREASAIHTVYPEYLRHTIKTRVLHNNSPFMSPLFVSVDNAENSRENVLDNPGSVIIASSGMLTGGPSLSYFYKLADSEKNTLVFVGYQAKDSMGWKLQKGLRSFLITDEQGKAKHIDVKMNIVTADAFSGHANRQELLSYINNLKDKPSTIIVNHGNACQDFAKTVSQKFHLNAVAIKNLESVRLR